jgi:hypothetical protein
MVVNGGEWCKMVPNGVKWCKIVGNSGKQSLNQNIKMSKISRISKISILPFYHLGLSPKIPWTCYITFYYRLEIRCGPHANF